MSKTPIKGHRNCIVCGESKKNNKFSSTKKVDGSYWYHLKCSSCVHAQSKKPLLTSLECAANNYISDCKRWLISGVVMNLAKPSFQLRAQL